MNWDKVTEQLTRWYTQLYAQFNAHPRQSQQNYGSHAAAMLTVTVTYLWTTILSLVHLLFPFWLVNYCHNRGSGGYTRLSDYELVKKFTRAAGTHCPGAPKPMSRERVEFLIRMVLSEMQELALTVTDSTEEALQLVRDSIGADPSEWRELTDTVEVIADQEDALADAWVYMLNVAAEHGQDISSMFQLVMASNMAKIDPITGKCTRRKEDGKILKPAGWKAPDTVSEVQRQLEEGTDLAA
jgi:predicted HAD superfamily Cof-like phosphohydrolase